MTNIKETIQKVEDDMRDEVLTENPHQCAQYVALLSGDLAFYLGKQGIIAHRKAKTWLLIRDKYKSDNQAEKAWELTEDGIEYNWYENRIKRIKALLTGLKTLIRNAESEQHNLH